MTISSPDNKVVYEGNGVLTQFSYSYRMDNDADMQVFLDNFRAATGFTVFRSPDDVGGLVTFEEAPGAGVSITLLREVALTQDIDYQPYDAFPAATHELALDKLTMAIQQVSESVDRTPTIPPDSEETPVFPTFDAGKVIGWGDEVSDPMVNYPGDVTFKGWVDQTDANAVAAAASEVNAEASALFAGDAAVDADTAKGFAFEWAQAPEDQIVDDTINTGFSSYHWALKAAGSRVEIRTDTPDTLTILEEELGHFVIDTRTNQSNALAQLDAGGLIPTELLPFTGLSLQGPFLPEVLEINADNPSLRDPGREWLGGEWYIIADTGYVLASDMGNLGAGELALATDTGDGIIYLLASTGVLEGWYLVRDLISGDIVTANNVTFDDTGTHLSGTNVQVFNGALDAELFDVGAEAAIALDQIVAHEADWVNPHQVVKAQVGLGSVDNTADLDKPISNDTQAALDLKADITYVDAGLALKANTAGVDASLALKANLDSPDLTGVPTAPTAAEDTDTEQIATTAFVQSAIGGEAGGGGGLSGMQIFNINGAWEKPEGVTRIKITCTAGGGGGGGGPGGASSAAGGGAGGSSILLLDVSAIGTVPVTVGAGAPTTPGSSDGAAGLPSSFGTHCSAEGGFGGRSSGTPDAGGPGGGASGAGINVTGGDGGSSSGNPGGGTGGGSFYGSGGQGNVEGQWDGGPSGDAYPGRAYGAGGGGARRDGLGGSGATGLVVIEEYS